MFMDYSQNEISPGLYTLRGTSALLVLIKKINPLILASYPTPGLTLHRGNAQYLQRCANIEGLLENRPRARFWLDAETKSDPRLRRTINRMLNTSHGRPRGLEEKTDLLAGMHKANQSAQSVHH